MKNKVDLLEEIKTGFKNLAFGNSNELDKLERRLKMLITNIYSDSSKYLEDLDRIDFSPMYIYEGIPRSDYVESWESGRNSATNLVDTIIEEQNIFANDKYGKNEVDLFKGSSKVFIVHGHDNEAKTEVARFIERLGLEAIILHEQPNSGATIIEKLEQYTDVGFAIVLYTPCDMGSVKSDLENLSPRARQNVVLEHGLLIGKIGRKNVVALVKDKVEIPNDISGVVYETMDSKGAWKYQVAREMKASGYDVDMNKV